MPRSRLWRLCWRGVLLHHFSWGSVFLVTVPIAAAAFGMAWFLVPAHMNETTRPVDHPGGILSVVMVAALILCINFVVVPNSEALVISLAVIAVAGLIAFVLRQRRAPSPLYDLHVAGRTTFWVAAVAGIIVFGSLMGRMFIGQQFLQNVLDYGTEQAGAAIIPTAVMMVLVAPRSAKMVENIGSRLTLLIGYAFIFLGFLTMLLLWQESSRYWEIGLGYALMGVGVGFAATPAARSLTGSVPTTRVGMASGTADLQRDLGGALMQSIFGALLTAGYAAALTAAIAASPDKDEVTAATQSQLTKSFDSASAVAAQYPQYSQAIISAAKTSFLEGDRWAYTAGLVAVLLGAALVYVFFPRKEEEIALLAGYQKADALSSDAPASDTRSSDTHVTDRADSAGAPDPESP